MKRIIILHGAIAGVMTITTMILGLAMAGESGGASGSQLVGYLIMLMALSLIFVGIKRYRDRDLGGVIRFGTAVVLGLGISLVAGAVYVCSWEVYLSVTDYTFIEEYTSALIEKKQAAGLSGAELQAEIDKMDEMKESYGKLLYRLPMTFLEIFPVGLLITLLSASLLRNEKFLPARG